MDKELLIRVLGTNNRVVIPSFGAFLRKQQGDALVFSPFLKGDDGFLAGVVSEEYGISDDDARAMVSAFAEHIASVLRARSKYYVDGVGTLVLDDNGSVTFVMDTTRQIPPSQVEFAQTPPVQPTPPTPQPQPINSPRPVAPQPISAARPAYTPPIAPQPQPAPTPIRPVAQARPVGGGGFARPQQPSAAPIAQPQPAQQPVQQQPIQQQPNPTPTQGQGQPQQQPPMQGQGTPSAPNGQRPTAKERPMNRSAVGTGTNGRRRVAARKKGKNDVWLVVAIVAALVVIILMVIGILTANEMNSLQL